MARQWDVLQPQGGTAANLSPVLIDDTRHADPDDQRGRLRGPVLPLVRELVNGTGA